MNDYEIELIQKAIDGDKKALVELIRIYETNIYTTLFYLKKDRNDLNDLAQDVLIKLSKKIHQLKNPKYFKTWLNQIIINSYYDYLRKNKKNLINIEKNIDEDVTSQIPDKKNNPQDAILYSELDYVIKTSIENLPLHYKIPIALREIQGLSYFDISQITKTSIGTVKSRIARARSMIKNNVDKYERS